MELCREGRGSHVNFIIGVCNGEWVCTDQLIIGVYWRKWVCKSLLYNRGLLCGMCLQEYFIIGVGCEDWVC